MSGLDFDELDKLFVLGVERSGSTWLANILDSSPSVDLYMEPFAEVARIVKGFPDRLSYLGGSNPRLEERVADTLAGLPDLKYHGLEGPGSRPLVRRLNWRLQQGLSRLAESVGGRRSWTRRRFRELNLGRVSNRAVFEFEKNAPHRTFAVKELRLNFKVRFLRALFPEARFLVIIRNPLAQIDSMGRQFDRGSLVYLERYLDALPEAFRDSRRLGALAEAYDEIEDAGSMSRRLLYWFANYTVLLEDLEATEAPYRVVRHEDLCRSPRPTARQVLSFAGLDWTEQTADYLDASTSGAESDGQRAATDTSRQTDNLVERSLRRLDEQLRESFWKSARPFWELAPEPVASYQNWLREAVSG